MYIYYQGVITNQAEYIIIVHAHERNSYMLLLGVHEMHGQVHPK